MRSVHQQTWMPRATVVVGMLCMVGPAGALRPTESDFAESESLASAKADLRNAATQLDEALKTGSDEEIHQRVKDLSNHLHSRSEHRAHAVEDFALQDDALATNIIHSSEPVGKGEALGSTELQSSVDDDQVDGESASSSATSSELGTDQEGEGQQDELAGGDSQQDELTGEDESVAASSQPVDMTSMSKTGQVGEGQDELTEGDDQQEELTGEDAGAAAGSEPVDRTSMSKTGEVGEGQDEASDELTGGDDAQDELTGDDAGAAAGSEINKRMDQDDLTEEDDQQSELSREDTGAAVGSMSKIGDEGQDQDDPSEQDDQQGELTGRDAGAAAVSEPDERAAGSKASEEDDVLSNGAGDAGGESEIIPQNVELPAQDGSVEGGATKQTLDSDPPATESSQDELAGEGQSTELESSRGEDPVDLPEDAQATLDEDLPALRTSDGSSTFVQTEALGEKMKKLVGEFSSELDVTDKGAETAVDANDNYRTTLKNLNKGLAEFSAGVGAFRSGTAKAHMEKTNAIKAALEEGIENEPEMKPDAE